MRTYYNRGLLCNFLVKRLKINNSYQFWFCILTRSNSKPRRDSISLLKDYNYLTNLSHEI